ncbi:MAG: FAD-dependent oxidoreductase [Deltaproteobacteria bacterium]
MIQQKQVNEYDVILLGSGLGSLVAGILLSRGKRSVLLLKERGYQPSFTREGYRFVPFSNFSEKIIRSPSLKKLFQALALQPLVSSGTENNQTKTDLSSPAQKVPFQVILPEARVDLYCDRAQLHGEWKREFPGELPRIEQFYNETADCGNRLKKEGSRAEASPFFPLRHPSLLRWFNASEPLLRFSPFSMEFKTFIELQFMAWGSLLPDRCATSLAAYLLSLDESSEWVSNVDQEELKGTLLAEYLRSGGRVEEIHRVEEVHQGWRKGFALMLAGDQKIIRSKFLVLHSPLHRIVNLPGKRGKQLSTWAQRIKPRSVVSPLFLAVQEKVIPVGMKDLLISIQDLEKPYEGGNLLMLALSPKGDGVRAPEGKRSLTVESLIPWETYNEHWDLASMDEHKTAVMKHLCHLIPFLENHIEFMDSDWGNELIRHWSYPHFFYESAFEYHWREGLVPTRISRNLYLAGNENFPYLGLEGEALSGWMVAREISKKAS